nr:PAS domain-containing protein [Pseudoruegeria sp. SK021]
MKHPAMAQVEAYWEGLRGGRPIPFRSEIDPRGIDRALEHAFILERIAPGVARFRLAGSHLNDLMGMEVRGMPVTTLFTPDARRQISDAMEHLFEQPATVRFHLVAETGFGKPALTADVLLLPLKSDLGDVSRALGCLVTEGQIGRTPRRFDLEAVEVLPVAGVAVFPDSAPAVPARGIPASDVPAETVGFAEDQKPFAALEKRTAASKLTCKTAPPYLRLVSSNDDTE